MGFFGDIAGGALGLIGVDMQRSSANKRQDKSNRFTAAQAEIDRAEQERFAKHSLTWQIDQVRKAGISPLAVLGNNPSYAPVGVQGDSGQFQSSGQSSFQKMGQGIGDLLSGQLSKTQKELAKIGLLKEKEQLKRLKLENLGMQYNYEKLINKPSVPSPSESSFLAGQDVNIEQAKRVAESKTSPGTEPGQSMRYQWVKSPGGRWYAVTTKELAEVLESDTSAWTKFMVEELARFTKGLIYGKPDMRPPNQMLGKNKQWKYNRMGYWYQVPLKIHKRPVGKAPWEKKKYKYRYPSDIGM